MSKNSLLTEHLETFLNWGIHIPTATIIIENEVNAEALEDFTKKLHFLEHLLSKGHSTIPAEITIKLNNCGGEVLAGMAIYDLIVNCDFDVKIIVEGEASSMGAIILQAADTRQMLPSSIIMIHDGERELSGHKRTVGAWNNLYNKMDERGKQILTERIQEKNENYKKGVLTRTLLFDTVYTAEEALETGLVDEILEPGV